MIDVTDAIKELLDDSEGKGLTDKLVMHGVNMIYVIAACQRLKALTAAVDRVADYVGEIQPEGHDKPLRHWAEESARERTPRAEGDDS